MVQYSNATMERFFGSPTAIATASVSGNRPLPKTGRKRSENSVSGFRPETTSFSRSSGKGNNFNVGGLFLENYSQPPLRAEKTHEANLRAALHLKAFGPRKLGEISAADIEFYLRRRLQDRVRLKTAAGLSNAKN
jgi:hypothetical protein